MEDAARTSPRQRLAARARIGDLILTGSGDAASRVIQYGSCSQYSHAAIVTDHGMVTEAYDYSLTLAENDEGVYHTSFADFLARSEKLQTVMIRRPVGVDVDRLKAAAKDLHRDSPPYPTFGALMLSVCRMFSETVPLLAEGLFGQRRVGKRIHRRLDDLATKQVRFIGDGARKIHCAESVLLLYEQAGVVVELPDPLLWRSMARARPFEANGRDQRHRRTVTSERIGRPQPSRTRSANLVMRSVLAIHRLVEGLPRAMAGRLCRMNEAGPSDYVFPADLVAAEPFELVDEFTVNTSGRRFRRWPHRRSRAPRAQIAVDIC